MTKTVLYARVSTADQTLDHQKAQAEAAGFKVDEVVADHGVSGLSTRLKEREQGRRLFDILRRGDVLVVRWLDRLGRNYEDVKGTVEDLMRRGVIVRTVINGMTFDGATTDPMQKAVTNALLGFMAAMGEAQAEATKAAQKAGIAHARETDPNSYKGRKPSFTRDQVGIVRNMLARGDGVSLISETTGLTRQTVYRIKGDPAGAEATLATWGL
ncbi:recombinase family protein [Prosthecomicrobium sp. N25]|uniref:recombinase family protein n=1 Tax=Prosthecomicrobium sp. N25 TaxID=3129254 RepID=UPI003076E191